MCGSLSSSPDSSPDAATVGTGATTELADLRRIWGEAYRITWDSRFRATHIASGQTIDADSALELRRRIRNHFSDHTDG